MICGREGADVAAVGVVVVGEALGVENAPVEDFCRRSYSSCSFGGRRGGEGPVANADRGEDEVKRRVVVCEVEESLRWKVLRAKRRDMFVVDVDVNNVYV